MTTDTVIPGAVTESAPPPPSGAAPDRRALVQARLARAAGRLRRAPAEDRLPAAGPGPVPLAAGQARLWFLDRMSPGTPEYNVPLAVRLSGPLDVAALRSALDWVLVRHEALRTTVATGPDGTPVQQVAEPAPVDFRVLDVTEQTLPEALRTEAELPFDLTGGPLLRARLLRLGPSEQVLLITVHHLVFDGWSSGLLFRDLTTAYTAFLPGGGGAGSLPAGAAAPAFRDFAARQAEHLAGDGDAAGLAYWKERLAEVPELELPGDFPRPGRRDWHGTTVHHLLGERSAVAVRRLAQDAGTTPFTVLLTAFAVLMGRRTGQRDFAVGVPVAGRTRSDLESVIGFFVNTVPVRMDLTGRPSFAELLRRTAQQLLADLAHQDVPFDRLVEALRPDRTQGGLPLFQVMFATEPADEPLTLGACRGEELAVPVTFAKSDLDAGFQEVGEDFRLSLTGPADLLTPDSTRRMLGHFVRLVEGLVADPAAPVDLIDLLDEQERAEILALADRGPVPYPDQASLVELFAEQAARTPDATAVRHPGELPGGTGRTETLTYRELDAAANRLAHLLAERGVTPGGRVAVCLPRGARLVTALLAVLKTGACYVPLDPEHPVERRRAIARDAGVTLIATTTELAAELAGPADDPTPPALLLDGADGRTDEHPDTAPAVLLPPDATACVFYTSGSTGTPKGVLVPHRAVVRLVRDNGYLTFHPQDRVAQVSNAAFDAATLEIWGALLAGAELVGLPKETVLSAEALADAIRVHGLTVMVLTTALLNAAARERPDAFSPLRVLLFGGEAADPAVVRILLDNPPGQLLNVYGPTETTSLTTTFNVTPAALDARRQQVPIGRPIDNSSAYVLDEHQRLVPFGTPGELYLGGTGLADGYLGRPGLTADRFLPNPFGTDGERLYRTGDRVRLTGDGELEFLGRTDHQVKIRGFRIELGEVETALAAHPDVSAAVVTVDGEGAGRRLLGYLVPAGEPETGFADRVRTELRRRLPGYMVPAALIVLDALPITPNGKVDRAALPRPALLPLDESGHVAPRDLLENTIAELWGRLLRLERVGVHDDFFDLGGHSLLATRVIAGLHQLLDVELPLRSFFALPTVAGLAEAVRSLGDSAERAGDGLVPVPRTRPLPLSPAQERLWLLSQMSAVTGEYNVPMALRLTGPLDRTALRAALDRLVERHEVLRSRIAAGPDGIPHQQPDPADCGATLDERIATPDFDRRAAIAAEVSRDFDLTVEHPLRAILWQLSTDEHILLLVAHHVAMDGWSMDLLRREFGVCYTAALADSRPELPELRLQYADFAVWQRDRLDESGAGAELEFWRERLAGATATELPGDHPRPPVRSGRGDAIGFTLPEGSVRRLRALGQANGTTLFGVLLAGIQALFHRLTGDEDIVLGTTVAGRDKPQLENVVGCFVNSVVLRSDLAGSPTFSQLLERTRARTLEAFAHQDLPFDQLVSALRPVRDPSRTPLFQVMFSFRASDQGEEELAGLASEELDFPLETTKFDLVINVTDQGDRLEGVVEYATELYQPETIRQFASSLGVLLDAVAAEPGQRICDLPIVTAEDLATMAEWGRSSQLLSTGPRTVHQLVEEQTDRTPEAVAVRHRDGELTFLQLDERANRLAHALLEGRLGAAPLVPETPVALLLDRGPDLLVAMLAVLKAGGYFIPLDPDYPASRLARMIGTAAPGLVLTRAALLGSVPAADADRPIPAVPVDDREQVLADCPNHRPNRPADPRALVYAIFTSGSTGTPKGVAIEHLGAVHYLTWAADHYPRGGARGTLVHSSVSFDLTMSSLLEPLISGRGLTLLPADAKLPELAEALSGDIDYDYIRLTPSHLRHLVAHWMETGSRPAAAGWVVGGEVLDPRLVAQVHGLRPDSVVVNHYGPTETVIGRVVHPMADGDPIDQEQPLPLGRPLGETRLQVLDSRLRPVPIGTVGELFIGGEGVARGYLASPALTAERFLPDPTGAPADRMYRTGDLVRWRSDGRLDFLGRADQQVKLRGFRIEPSEIESRLTEHPSVGRALVLVQGEQLVAYLTPAPGEQVANVSLLRRFCAEQLPEFMVPSHCVVLDAFPLSPNGKVDRAKLPVPTADRPELEQSYQVPRTPAEQLMAQLWSEVLGVERIGIEDNFFDLGGTSVDVIRLAGSCAKAGIRLLAKDVFEHQTVRTQALTVAQPERQSAGVLGLDAVFGSGGTGTTRTVVALRTEGTGRPLFCVHPSGGSVGWYVPLTRVLSADHPLYAFQPLGMDGVTPPFETMADMAAGYIADMRAIQPHGPYAILGWSLGGTIAYEMGRQLELAGEEARLVLLEPTLPGVARTIELHRPAVRSYLQGAVMIERILAVPEHDPARERLRSELVTSLEAAGYSPEEISLGDALPMRACGQMLAAFAEYRPEPLRSELVTTRLVISDECRDASEEKPSGTSHFSCETYLDGWRDLVATDHGRPQEALRTSTVGGRHATMLAAEQLPAVVEFCLRAVQDDDPNV
ncbi:amino acid adenylation domain-containing protein [Kitasatospora sp. NPDC018058]|uniref:amino acid adenylation domain-containing protein n=1 Tax=Kitasatospora sp. NPDC018058 TaxID=3364025 RepID=UPI0037BF3652